MSYLPVLARDSKNLCSRVTCVCTPIAQVRNTRERLSMYVRTHEPQRSRAMQTRATVRTYSLVHTIVFIILSSLVSR